MGRRDWWCAATTVTNDFGGTCRHETPGSSTTTRGNCSSSSNCCGTTSGASISPSDARAVCSRGRPLGSVPAFDRGDHHRESRLDFFGTRDLAQQGYLPARRGDHVVPIHHRPAASSQSAAEHVLTQPSEAVVVLAPPTMREVGKRTLE